MASTYLGYELSDYRVNRAKQRLDDEKQWELNCLGVDKQVAGANKYFDFVSFYSRFSGQRDTLFRPSDGTHVSLHSLRDKYLLLCFVSLSLKPLFVPQYLKGIFKLYHRLVSRAGGAFEMVIISDSRNQADFDYFFTPEFPGLTIPFSESQFGSFICEFIYMSIGLTPTKPEHDLVGLILDPTCMVLQENYCGRCFAKYGIEFFPFTYDRVNELIDTDNAIRARLDFPDAVDFVVKNPVSLADLLSCEPSRVLYRIGGGCGGCEDKITVRELSQRNCVGVYICGNGSFMSELASMYNEFHKVDQRDFEIVMVRLHDEDIASIEPELANAWSWWDFPYNNETSLRLQRLYHREDEDNFTIVRPDGKFWDSSGRAVLHSDGIAAYPFTKESYLERMISVTVDSLLGGNSQTLVKIRNFYNNHKNNNNNNNNNHTTVGRCLQGRNVLVYFGIPASMKSENFGLMKRLRKAYYHKKHTMDEFEVVFVPLYTTSYDDPKLKYCIRKMPSTWFMLLPKFVNTFGLFTRAESQQSHQQGDIVAFGYKDGRIRSKLAGCHYLSEPGGISTLFAQELIESLQREFECMLDCVDEHFQILYDYLKRSMCDHCY